MGCKIREQSTELKSFNLHILYSISHTLAEVFHYQFSCYFPRISNRLTNWILIFSIPFGSQISPMVVSKSGRFSLCCFLPTAILVSAAFFMGNVLMVTDYKEVYAYWYKNHNLIFVWILRNLQTTWIRSFDPKIGENLEWFKSLLRIIMCRDFLDGYRLVQCRLQEQRFARFVITIHPSFFWL